MVGNIFTTLGPNGAIILTAKYFFKVQLVSVFVPGIRWYVRPSPPHKKKALRQKKKNWYTSLSLAGKKKENPLLKTTEQLPQTTIPFSTLPPPSPAAPPIQSPVATAA